MNSSSLPQHSWRSLGWLFCIRKNHIGPWHGSQPNSKQPDTFSGVYVYGVDGCPAPFAGSGCQKNNVSTLPTKTLSVSVHILICYQKHNLNCHLSLPKWSGRELAMKCENQTRGHCNPHDTRRSTKINNQADSAQPRDQPDKSRDKVVYSRSIASYPAILRSIFAWFMQVLFDHTESLKKTLKRGSGPFSLFSDFLWCICTYISIHTFFALYMQLHLLNKFFSMNIPPHTTN